MSCTPFSRSCGKICRTDLTLWRGEQRDTSRTTGMGYGFLRQPAPGAPGKNPGRRSLAFPERRGVGCRKAKNRPPTETESSEEAVFGGEAGGLGARVDSQLAVDRAQVPFDGAGTQEKFPCDLGVGQPGGDQAQHFGLSGIEARRICHWVGALRIRLLLQGVLDGLLGAHHAPLLPRSAPRRLAQSRACDGQAALVIDEIADR